MFNKVYDAQRFISDPVSNKPVGKVDTMHKALLLATALSLFLPISAAYAEFYSWTDKKGIGHATDDLSKVPEEYRAQALANKIPDEENAGAPGMKQGSQAYPAAPATRMKKAKKGQADTEHTDRYGRGEEYWRERADELRQRIAELQEEYEYASRQERECEEHNRINYLGKRPDCASIYGTEKSRVQHALDRARKSLEVDLPDEARKQDAYPGWLR